MNSNWFLRSEHAIISPKQDLVFLHGGAYWLVPIMAVMILWPASVPVLFWFWALCFDGPHLWATLSRTYIDLESWRSKRTLYLGSLIIIILPVLIYYIGLALNQPSVFFLFLSFAMLWAYHHIVRQHYGFLSLYDRKSNSDPNTHRLSKRYLYLGLWLPYLHLGLNHPVNIKLFGLQALHQSIVLHQLIFWLPITLSALIIAHVAWLAYRHQQGRNARVFLLHCLLSHSLILYVFSRFEPVIGQSRNDAQYFMGITLLLTLFHNVQYLAFVWQYNRRVYGVNPKDSSNPAKATMARLLNQNFLMFFLCALVFSSVYVYFEWAMNDYPNWRGQYHMNTTSWSYIALSLWWGLSMHHYYLDQKIWRPSRSNRLASTLSQLNEAKLS